MSTSSPEHRHSVLDVALLTAELAEHGIAVEMCRTLPSPVVHFKYKGVLYCVVQGMMEARDYRRRIEMLKGQEPRFKCSHCGQLVVKD